MKRLKVKVVSMKYSQNDKKRTIVCIINYAALLPNGNITKRGVAVGIAKCSPDDSFDVNKGKKIAYSRAIINARSSVLKLVSKTVFKLIALSEIIVNTQNKLTLYNQHDCSYLDKLLK